MQSPASDDTLEATPESAPRNRFVGFLQDLVSEQPMGALGAFVVLFLILVAIFAPNRRAATVADAPERLATPTTSNSSWSFFRFGKCMPLT